jgi:hypothetical protein
MVMLDKLLNVLPPGQRARTASALEEDGVAGLVIWKAGDRLIVQIFDAETKVPDELDVPPVEGAKRVGWWSKAAPEAEEEFRTRRAYEWWEAHPDASGRDAGAKFNVSPSAVYKFAASRKRKPICPTCGQVVKAGFRHKEEA